MKVSPRLKKKHLILFIKSFFWFFTGAFLGLFFLISFTFIVFQKHYANTIYPGIMVDDVNLEGKTQEDVKTLFAGRNTNIDKTKFVFVEDNSYATVSARELTMGYDQNLLAKQAYGIGRSDNILSNISLIFQAYLHGVYLSPSYHYDERTLEKLLLPITQKIAISPIDALFTFQNGKVTAFRPSRNGQEVDIQTLENTLSSEIPLIIASKPEALTFNIPIKILKPKITTDKVNSLGIKELIGSGTSLFQHSIPNRIYNVTLAATRLNGILVSPGETFSFGLALGDVSSFTGYKQAYVIQNNRTVLGDGGGVCQVSTTFFRALLNAGLPILERHAHDYRVGYYEQDSPPGFDATVYVPSIDLQFKNDMQNSILIQTVLDPSSERLTFLLYGTKDNRQVTISKPVITNQTPAPAPLYQDDPTLPKGETKQVDFDAPGANVSFTRQVVKSGKTISEKFVSNYRPWQAVFLRGTKE